MSTGTEIVRDALQRIGAHSVASPANPEAIETGRKMLNSMLETWLSQNIRIGFTPIEVPGDDINEPADTRNGIVNNLALLLAPDFDNGRQIVSPNLAAQARAQYAQIRKTYQPLDIPEKGVSSTLVRGQGNRHRFNPFFGSDATISE